MNKGPFRIEIREDPPRGGLYELECSTHFDLVEVATGRVLMSFEGTYSASFGGDGQWSDGAWSGVRLVELADDGAALLVYRADQEVPERRPLVAPEGGPPILPGPEGGHWP